MKQTWRWFGPVDKISIDEIMQSGAQGIVSALHHIANGEVWSIEEIAQRKKEISVMKDGKASHLTWDVVESLPVSENIKKQNGQWRQHIENYKQSLRNLGAEGVEIVCYNFMPVLDWTRTDLAWRMPHGGTTMRFDLIDFAAFDIHVLKRKGAKESFSKDIVAAAQKRFEAMEETTQKQLANNIACGLPGSTEHLTLDGVRQHLAEYNHLNAERLRQNFVTFLEEVIPIAEEAGIRMCCHPDDPPFPLLGLPRIMSTEEDYTFMLNAVDRPANGMALCAGSLGARADNDLPGMVERLGSRIHFFHLRNVRRETTDTPTSFHEAEHLAGDTDMVLLIAAILREENKRLSEGRKDACIPIRPDHGLDIMDDLERDGQPGYSSIGRMKGLAELRGVIAALSHSSFNI